MVNSDVAQIVLQRLSEKYPYPKSALNFTNPLELLVATILSAQCTDVRVNIVTSTLFKKYRLAADYADSDNLEEDIKSINFYRNKAKNIKKAAQILVEKFDGEVPGNMEDLLSLPGVARKTANVVLSNIFGINAGFVVDTHVKRVSGRLGLTTNTDPKKVEQDLVLLFPQNEWGNMSHRFVFLGREICKARVPDCINCPLNDICPSSRVK